MGVVLPVAQTFGKRFAAKRLAPLIHRDADAGFVGGFKQEGGFGIFKGIAA